MPDSLPCPSTNCPDWLPHTDGVILWQVALSRRSSRKLVEGSVQEMRAVSRVLESARLRCQEVHCSGSDQEPFTYHNCVLGPMILAPA